MLDDDSHTTVPEPCDIQLARPFLVVLQSPVAADAGRIIMVADGMSIGRSAEADVSLKDSGLSRRHIEIVRTATACTIRDLGSRNGTRVNGAPVSAIDLQPGDQIQLGATLLLFQDGVTLEPIQHRIATSGVALWEYDIEHDELAFSEQVDVALELPPSALGRRRLRAEACIHPEDRARFAAALAAIADRPLELELRLAISPALERWVMLRGHGTGPLVAGSLVDITALKRREATLARSALMFESFLDGVALVDPGGEIVDLNTAMATMLGRSRAEMLGRDVFADVLAEDAVPPRHDVEAAVAADGRWTAVAKLASAPDRWFDTLVFPLRTDLGEAAGMAWVFRDVTEKHKLAAQVAFLDRLASLGTLSAGIAHEINNPLAFIVGNAEFVRDGLGPDQAPLIDALDELAEGARRIARIVRDLKVFARAEVGPQVRATDVARAIELALRMTGPVVRARARVVTSIAPVSAAAAVESRLVQVLVNLLMNAVEAIPDATADARIGIKVAPSSDGIEIAITDNGCGLTPEVAARAFEPFFTTKPMNGTGLGLSICHGLVTDMGGTIALEPAEQGACAKIWLRCAEQPAPVAAVPAAAEPVARARLRILAIDDEPMVLKSIARMLKDHDVVTVEGCRAAARPLFEDREHFDVVLCDLMMPDGTGMDLHARMLAERPELAPTMVFITGGAFTEAAEAFLDATTNSHLLKPVDGPTLRQLIQQRGKR